MCLDYCPSDQESLFKIKDFKSGETKTLHIRCHGLKVNGGMLPAKNSKADIVKFVFYSMASQQMHQKEIL